MGIRFELNSDAHKTMKYLYDFVIYLPLNNSAFL